MSLRRERICDCCLRVIEGGEKWYRARYQGYGEAATFDSGWFSMRQHICTFCWAAIAVVSTDMRREATATRKEPE